MFSLYSMEVSFQIKFHPEMQFYSFHPGMKLTSKVNFFIPWWHFISVTCKRTLNFNLSFRKWSIMQKEKAKWKVYALFGKLSGKILSYFLFCRRNLKVSIFSVEISRLINFVFSRERVLLSLRQWILGNDR